MIELANKMTRIFDLPCLEVYLNAARFSIVSILDEFSKYLYDKLAKI